MGKKGDQLTSDALQRGGELADRLAGLGNVTSKKMFGGIGLFESKKMFAMVDSAGDLFFRGGQGNSDRFEKAGSTRHGRMPYWSVPDEVLADDTSLKEWARSAIDASRAG